MKRVKKRRAVSQKILSLRPIIYINVQINFLVMKKILLLVALTIVMAGAYAQQNHQIRVDARLYDVLTEAQINDLRANNPKQLVEENCNLVSYCFLALKPIDDVHQVKGELKNFVKPGKTCNYQEIIKTGCINRYDYNLEQDPYKLNVYTMGNTGAYIVVFSKQDFTNTLNAFLREYGLE